MKSRFFISMPLVVLCILVPFLAHAGAVPPPHPAPFNGGLSLLIAAGVGYASKKAYDKRKKDNPKSEE